MKTDNLPKFRVETIHYEANQTIIVGKANRWEWIGEGHYAFMLVNEHTVIVGKFRDVDERSMKARFIPDGLVEKGKIQPKKAYPYLDGYWGERAELVFDNSLEWTRLDFEPRDAIATRKDGSKELVRDGWDHEHCHICWATISLHENTSYMKSSGDDNVCLECFEKYVEKQSIDFIV